MALPALLRRLFKSSGYGPELNDDLVSRNIFIRQWINSYDYDAGVLVRGSDGQIYMSVVASGPGTQAGVQNPTTAGVSYWVAPKIPTAGVSEDSNVAASTAFVKAAINAAIASVSVAAAVPVGCIMYYGSTSAPSKWRICNGGAISRTTYADLFAVIGTRFGAGDGSTTFNVPNLIDRFPHGSTTPGTVKAAGLPNITGRLYDNPATKDTAVAKSGAFTRSTFSTYRAQAATSGGSFFGDTGFDASRSSSIYGKSTTVQPPALTLLPIIKVQAG